MPAPTRGAGNQFLCSSDDQCAHGLLFINIAPSLRKDGRKNGWHTQAVARPVIFKAYPCSQGFWNGQLRREPLAVMFPFELARMAEEFNILDLPDDVRAAGGQRGDDDFLFRPTHEKRI